MGKSLLLLYIITVGFHYYQSLTVAFYIVKSSRPKESCNFIKKEFLAQVFSCKFWESFKSTLFTEHLRETDSVKKMYFEADVLKTLRLILQKALWSFKKVSWKTKKKKGVFRTLSNIHERAFLQKWFRILAFCFSQKSSIKNI